MKLVQPASEVQWQQYYELRWRVLREPWQQDRGSERDELESESEHVMALSDAGVALGVGRVHFVDDKLAQIRYMAVDQPARGQGIGTQVLGELEAIARVRGAATMVLNARDDSVEFYKRHGYQTTGRGHTLFGVIHHTIMKKRL